MRFLALFYILTFLIPINVAYAKTREVKIVNNINVSAQVPGFNLYVSGLFSPNSNVVLYNKQFLKGLGAFKTDSKGYFEFKISLGYTDPVDLCVSGIALDNSNSRPHCFSIDLKRNNYYIKNVYLSPTIKLKKDKEDYKMTASGYTMPNTSVIVVVDKNVYNNVTSDGKGKYSVNINIGDTKDHEMYVYGVGSSFVTKESRYIYFTSSGFTYELSQNYLYTKSIYSLVDVYFKYILIPLIVLFFYLFFLMYQKNAKKPVLN